MTEPVSVSERAVRDTATQFGSQLAVGLFAVAFAAWLNRMLPARELAVWPLCLSLGGVISALASFGTGDSFVRLLPALRARGRQEEAARLLRTGLLLIFATCAALSVAVYFASAEVARYLLHDPQMTSVVRPMAFAAFFIAFGERLTWVMQAVQEFSRRALINAVVGIIRTPLAVGLYILLAGPRGVVLALTVTPLLGCVLSLVWLWRHLAAGRGLAPLREVLGISLPFYGVSLASLACGRMNQIIIALLVRPEVLAAYFVANSIAGYVASLDRFAVEATAPKLAEKGALAEGLHDTQRIFTKCTRYVALALVPLHVLVAIAAEPLLRLYGGAQYAGAGPVLAVLCLGLLASVLYDLHRAHMVAFARPSEVLRLSAINGVSNLGLLAWLAPALGALGAALADAITAVVLLVAAALMLRRTMRLKYDAAALRAAGWGTAAAGLVLWGLHPLWRLHASPALLGLTAASAVYALAVVRHLTPQDRQLLIRALPRRRRGRREPCGPESTEPADSEQAGHERPPVEEQAPEGATK